MRDGDRHFAGSSATPPQLETAFLACQGGEEKEGGAGARRGQQGSGGERGAEDTSGGENGAHRAEGTGRRKPARPKRPPKPSIDERVDAELADSAARQSGRMAPQSHGPHLPPLPLSRLPQALKPGTRGQGPLTDRIYPLHSPCSDPGAMVSSVMASARMLPSILGQSRPRSGGAQPFQDSPMSRARLALKQFKSANSQHALATGADLHDASGAHPAPRAGAAARKQPTIFERYNAANVALDHRRSSTILQSLIHNAGPAF